MVKKARTFPHNIVVKPKETVLFFKVIVLPSTLRFALSKLEPSPPLDSCVNFAVCNRSIKEAKLYTHLFSPQANSSESKWVGGDDHHDADANDELNLS